MNQSVIFTDRIEFSDEKFIELTAQDMGVNIPCRITIQQLSIFSGQQIETAEEAIAVAETLRFDLEELFEDKIDAEAIDDNGVVYF